MKDRVYLKHWIAYKPYKEASAVDLEFLRIANDVYQAILESSGYMVIMRFLNKEEVKSLSCFLTSYLEDLVSGSGIWNTFVRIHTRMYQKPIPFFNEGKYFEEEINLSDIQVLIWYYLNTIQDEQYIDGRNDFIHYMSEAVMLVFEEEWETAPENEKLAAEYRLEPEADYYLAREFAGKLIFGSYLFVLDTGSDLQDLLDETIEESKENERIGEFLPEVMDSFQHKARTKLLSLSAKEWAAELVGPNHPCYRAYMDMSARISGIFSFVSQNEGCYNLEHVATGEVFPVLKDSLDLDPKLQVPGEMMYLSVVQWRGEWWFSGILVDQGRDEKLIQKERTSAESLAALNELEPYRTEALESLGDQEKAFLILSGGHKFAFISESKRDNFMKHFSDSYSQVVRRNVFEGEAYTFERNIAKGDKGEVLYFNPEGGIEIAIVASCIPDPRNPFYDPAKAEDELNLMLYNPDISASFTRVCLETYKDSIAFLKQEPFYWYMDDLDFLFRFWKTDNYHSVPHVSIINRKRA